MSGGSFNYAYARVQDFADDLGCKLNEYAETNEYGDRINYYEPPVLAKLHEIKEIVEHAARLMKEVEWLYSADTGEDSFLRRVAEIEAHREAGEINEAPPGWKKTAYGWAQSLESMHTKMVDGLDAERYRFLRESDWGMFKESWLNKTNIYGEGSIEMDAAIDNAIAKGGN